MKIFPILLLSAFAAQARVVEYDLEISRNDWTPGPPLEAVTALTVNGTRTRLPEASFDPPVLPDSVPSSTQPSSPARSVR